MPSRRPAEVAPSRSRLLENTALGDPRGMFIDKMGWPEPDSAFARIGCLMEQFVMHHADLVVASNHATASFCSERCGYPLEHIEVVHEVETPSLAERDIVLLCDTAAPPRLPSRGTP